MANLGEEVLRIALNDLLARQELIDKSIEQSLTDKEISKLVHEQTEMLRSTTSLFNRMY